MSPTDPPVGPPAEEPPTRRPDTQEAIARDIDRLTRRVKDLGDKLGWNDEREEIWKTIQKLAERQNMLASDPAPAEAPTSRAWLLQVGEQPELLVERLTALVEWLDTVFLHYPGAQLPSCWMWHAWLVEELLWLQAYHGDAYSPRGTGVQQGMWHDQSMPNLVGRITKHAGSCDLSKHIPGGQAAKDPVAAPLGGHINDVAAAWATTGLAPDPTDEQREDARKHRELKLRRRNSST
jgi:hypothetical protein